MSTFPEAVSRSGHSVQPASFSADLYKRELERVFGRSWLFVGHESLVPETVTISPVTWERIRSSCNATAPVVSAPI